MSTNAQSSHAFAFRIEKVTGEYVYFKTVSLYTGWAKHRRDKRRAYPVVLPDFCYGMTSIGDSCSWIFDVSQLAKLVDDDCWGLVQISLAETHLRAFLNSKTCVKSTSGVYFDVELPRGRAAGRRPSSRMTKSIRERDGGRCVVCNRAETDGVTLENGHIMPYSGGWELSTSNLATLCKDCNAAQGNDAQLQLFAHIGIPYGRDLGLLKGVPSPGAGHWLAMLSQNILVSRVSLTDIPSWQKYIGQPLVDKNKFAQIWNTNE